MPKASHVVFGLRNLLLVSLTLMLISAVLALLFGVVSISYPADIITSIVLWIGVLLGSYATTKNLPRIDQPWLFGGIVGAAYAIVVFVVIIAFHAVTGSDSGQSVLGALLLILFYAVLGLVGATAGDFSRTSPREDFYAR